VQRCDISEIQEEKRVRKRSITWAGLILALAVVVGGSALGATGAIGHANRAQVLKESIGAEPPSLDPGLATDTTSANVLLNIMDPLVRLGPAPALKATPSAASSWTVHGATVTLNLRHDVRWSTGAPLHASDYVWSWLRTISPQLGADYAYQFFGIKGAEAYNSCDPGKSNCNALRSKVGVQALGKWKLRIQLTSPQAWFPQQLAHNSFLPVNKAAVTKYGSHWTEAKNIVTDGAFKLSSWKHDASLTLVKNTRWRGAKHVKLTKIVLTILTDATTALNSFQANHNDVDSTGLNPADIKSQRKHSYFHLWKALGTYYYGINVKNITNVNQRRAMAFGINRAQIVKYIGQLGQQPARGFTPAGIAGGPTILKHAYFPASAQVSKAKAFLKKVAHPKTDIHLYVNNAPGHPQIATAVQAQWKELGLNVSIKVQEWKQYLQFLGPPPNSDVDVYRLGWIYDYPDAQNGLVLWTCGSGNNNTNWCNKKFDRLVAQGSRTANATKRYALYQQAEDLLSSAKGDVPLIPIYWYVYSNLIRPYVHGYVINPMDQTDYSKVSMK
jgi:oligopeptide transport system substrate-binding protein